MQKTKMKVRKNESHFTFAMVLLLIGLIIYVISLFSPIIWGFFSSFKEIRDFQTNVIGLPTTWTFSNYVAVFSRFAVKINTAQGFADVGMGMLYVNGILYALGCAVLKAFVPCLVGYLCAKFPFKFSKVIYGTVIVVMIIPIVGGAPSTLQIFKALGLYDTIWGMWISSASFLGTYFLVSYGVFKGVSISYSEAAKIDGAGNMAILFRIVFPLIKYTFFTLVLINFIACWNDYQTPLLYMPSHPTIAYGMLRMSKNQGGGFDNIPSKMTAAMMMFIPTLTIFVAFNKRLLGNLTMGGLKG